MHSGLLGLRQTQTERLTGAVTGPAKLCAPSQCVSGQLDARPEITFSGRDNIKIYTKSKDLNQRLGGLGLRGAVARAVRQARA